MVLIVFHFYLCFVCVIVMFWCMWVNVLIACDELQL